MVRLKDTSRAGVTFPFLFQYLLVRLKDLANKNYEYLIIFQYLLVRLKEDGRGINPQLFQISIPLGTIKRNLDEIKKKVHLLFQYLLVRLKVTLPEFILPNII